MEQQEQQIQFVTSPMQKRVALALIPVLALAALVALTACDGGGGETPAAVETEEPEGEATPAGETPTQAPTAATALPEITSLCDLVTQEDVEEALGESVTGATEFMDVSCGYGTASGNSVNIERGSQRDFEVGVGPFRTGDLGEPVPGIGDQAAWFGEGQNILVVGKGDFYFQLRMNLPELDSAAQLEAAKDIADKAVARIP